MEKLTIVKVGGGILDEPTQLDALILHFAQINGHKILVHGGGKVATQTAKRLGVETQMVDGRRLTSTEMLEVVVMVYGGLVNKRVVAKLQAKQCNAAGFTGADANIILAEKRPIKTIDYGWVGDVKEVNTEVLKGLLSQGIVPVIAPLTHDKQGNLYNTNADTMASVLATALSSLYQVRLWYCFEKPGVLANAQDDNSVIEHLSTQLYQTYQQSGVITDGMLPKLDNGFAALRQGAQEVIIGTTTALGADAFAGTRLVL
ncbi:acetylglutamate kinase [Microscilla marina]|uniref:Acetylglutamate kinase n=1 Tax=Microscilla marina ATCC 23134 TaxID=313606 RepID=A1ZXA9_MICM2|nr:acetylglutamate kinase [Microscilla marina]EAY24983.1 acetylglutamate kinase [Microscilla marina ATCC 23134]